jgi:alkanesulfonate monooxygenase SsuD/methylene tetrahydromethanopterin reductase-like flavin-dependent oxidoreductase (luciferase family)
MHFGLFVPPFGPYADARVLAGLAHEAETAGWEGFFLWDHVFTEWPDRVVDPWVALTAMALSTQQIRLGTLVTPLPRRRPWKLARETVSLDHASNGRLILGVGLGEYVQEFDFLDEPSDLKVRAAMLDEGLEVLTGLWLGQPFHYVGDHYRIREALFMPPPVQQPRIPIWVAGQWPNKAPFRRAARWDGVFPLNRDDFMHDLSPDLCRHILRYIHEHRPEGTPFDFVLKRNHLSKDRSEDHAAAIAYEQAGVTWWVEGISPWRFGWQGDGAWPLAAMHDRILLGPPRE